MKGTGRGALLAALLLALAATHANGGDEKKMAQATMKDTEGQEVGVVDLRETPHGLLISADLRGLSKGWHGFHLHETGKCEPPFKSAGGHFNPTGKNHGILSEKGMHAGDLPNIHVGADGSLRIQYFAPGVTLHQGEQALLDEDGAAVVIHQGTDDYQTDPAGAAGPRVACGVVEAK